MSINFMRNLSSSIYRQQKGKILTAHLISTSNLKTTPNQRSNTNSTFILQISSQNQPLLPKRNPRSRSGGSHYSHRESHPDPHQQLRGRADPEEVGRRNGGVQRRSEYRSGGVERKERALVENTGPNPRKREALTLDCRGMRRWDMEEEEEGEGERKRRWSYQR